MTPQRFSVSQLRVAATCPRIFYFDGEETRRKALKQPSVTRIWKIGKGDAIALGSLFHQTVESFNSATTQDGRVRQLLEEAKDAPILQQTLFQHLFCTYLKQEKLDKASGTETHNFVEALRRYVGELATLLFYGRTIGLNIDEILDHMFGDKRRKVDVTFAVGPHGDKVEIVGILDYVFYDWRSERRRIIDYKLTPANAPTNDLFQVCVYALMHNTQHRSQADAAVLYLHPERHMVERKWEDIYAERHKVYDLLASMVAWSKYDEKTGTGLKPPGEPAYCNWCKWDRVCIDRLGSKHEGRRVSHWEKAVQAGTAPLVEVAPVVSDSTPPPNLPPGPPSDKVAEGLRIGHTQNGLPVVLSPTALPTHTAVVGAAGSGKTWLAKVIAEEVILQGIPVLVIDPQGDLVQFLRPAPADRLSGLRAAERARYERYWRVVEPRIYTPGTSHATRLSLNPLRLPNQAELAAIDNPQRRGEELQTLIGATAANLVNLAKAGGETDVQQTFLYRLLLKLCEHSQERELDLHRVIQAIATPEGVGFELADTFIKKSEREKLGRKLNAVLFGPGSTLFYGGSPLDLEALRRPTTLGRVPLNVIYLNALTDDGQKQFFVAALVTEIYRWMVSSLESGGAVQLLLYIDEARDYIPAGTSKPPAKQPLIRLFTQGRKYGVACLLCTQSPRSVDYNVFGNCSTKLIGRIESSQDTERIAEWFSLSGATPAWVSGRQGAAAGTFVGRWPEMASELEGVLIKSRPLYSLHEGAWPPERLEREYRELSDPL